MWTWATPQKTWSGKVWPTFGEDCPPPTTAGGVGLDQNPAVYFSSAAPRRSRGVVWPSIAPALSFP